MKRKLTLIASLAAAAALVGPVSPAVASDKDPSGNRYDKVAGGLTTPLHLAVGPNKSVYVTQDFIGEISRVGRDGGISNFYTSERGEGWGVAGVETRGATAFFLETFGAGGPAADIKGFLSAIGPRGDVREIADLAEHERKNNPDGEQQYGFGPEASQACLVAAAEVFGPTSVRYKGAIDSNAYATAVQGNTAYVADAGANAILKVNIHSGEVSTLAALPPRPIVVPAEAAEALGVGACGGFSYAFEFVPTDVEIGPDGWLYVTSLPGGPESPALGDRGAVFKVNPWTGRTKLWVEHILSPTGLAVAHNGDVYVASLFGDKIWKFHAWKGHRTEFLGENAPADVEIQGRNLYATVDAVGDDPMQPPAATGRVIKADIR